MRTAGKTRGSGQLPSRTALPALPGRLRRAGSGQPRRAIRRDPQHGDRSLRSPRRPVPGQRSGRLAQVTPSFPLTYRAMFETRQNLAPRRGGHVFALSVLVLLAMCCVPVLAQASSAGYQYSDAPPTVTGGKPPSQSNLSGGSKSTSGIGSPAGSGKSSGAKSSGGGNGSQAKSNGSGGGGNAAGQQGSQGNGSQKSPAGAGNANGGSPEPGSSGGGSSPLVPILIAIVLLAGGSIGYVLMKRRRQRKASGSPDSPGSADSSGSSGSSVSPEAG